MSGRFIHCVGVALVLAVLLVSLPTDARAAEQLVVVGWNAESGDADPAVVSARIEDVDDCDVWGICEVRNSEWADQFAAAAAVGEGNDFESVLGTTGGSDRMQIIYNSDRLQLIDDFELHRINVSGTVRAPLVAHFRIQGTQVEFLFMVNHLYRSKEHRRLEQATLLNRWAAAQTLPIIAVGDYNFDWETDVGDLLHDAAYDAMVEDGHFNWVRPSKLTKTQASPEFDAVLDFIFLGGDSWTWSAKSTILQRDDDDPLEREFPDDDQLSDHRPVRAAIVIE